MTEGRFAGQVALVTGAARPRGIGRATAMLLAEGGAAKSAVILLTQCLATELGGAGISVNAVCPGTVDTDLINPDGVLELMLGGPEGAQASIQREIPLGRLQSAGEIAATIVWLLSDDARAITGEAVNVSAGQTMV